jgi:hypothetical protein
MNNVKEQIKGGMQLCQGRLIWFWVDGNGAANMIIHMYGCSHPRNLFPTKQTFRVSCFPSKGFMFSLSRQFQGFHMPHLIQNQSGQQPVSMVSCSLSGRAVPRKPLLSMAPAEPPGPTPCCTMPQDRGDRTQANARRAHSHLYDQWQGGT